jgi:hypothetical protein
VEKHKIEREKDEGKDGVRSARRHGSVEAAGAAEGTLGLAAFGVVVWRMVPGYGLGVALGVAVVAWAAVSWMGWWVRERI